MSVLISGGPVRQGVRERVREGAVPHSVPGPASARLLRRRRGSGRTGETRRPPTRARAGTGHGRALLASCASRRVPVRWPWLAALALVACLAVTGLGLFADGMAAAGVPAETATVSIAPGETLSDLAARFAPASDAGAVVDRIKALNGLHDAIIIPGTPITVPVQSGITAAG